MKIAVHTFTEGGTTDPGVHVFATKAEADAAWRADAEDLWARHYQKKPPKADAAICAGLEAAGCTEWGEVASHDVEIAAPDPLRLMADLSTGHLRPSTREFLTSAADDGNEGFSCGVTQYGWFVTVMELDEEKAEDYPEDLVAAWKYAAAIGADFILFDRDADGMTDLPYYGDSEEAEQ